MLLVKLPTVGNSSKEVCSLHLISSKRGKENSACCTVSFSLGQQGQKGSQTILNWYKYSLKQPCSLIFCVMQKFSSPCFLFSHMLILWFKSYIQRPSVDEFQRFCHFYFVFSRSTFFFGCEATYRLGCSWASSSIGIILEITEIASHETVR